MQEENVGFSGGKGRNAARLNFRFVFLSVFSLLSLGSLALLTGCGGISSITDAVGSLTGDNIYDGTYSGQFVWETVNSNGATTPHSLDITLKLQYFVKTNGSAIYKVTHIQCTEPGFGATSELVPADDTTVALPVSPPTTVVDPSKEGEGISIVFPNGSTLVTTCTEGAMRVTTDGALVLQNSASSAIQNATWLASASTGTFHASEVRRFKSWILTKTSL
jgi:hypothetical protein